MTETGKLGVSAVPDLLVGKWLSRANEHDIAGFELFVDGTYAITHGRQVVDIAANGKWLTMNGKRYRRTQGRGRTIVGTWRDTDPDVREEFIFDNNFCASRQVGSHFYKGAFEIFQCGGKMEIIYWENRADLVINAGDEPNRFHVEALTAAGNFYEMEFTLSGAKLIVDAGCDELLFFIRQQSKLLA